MMLNCGNFSDTGNEARLSDVVMQDRPRAVMQTVKIPVWEGRTLPCYLQMNMIVDQGK